MTSKPLRYIEFSDNDPLSNGHQHGETFRREIHELAEIRMERMCSISHYHRPADVLAISQEHLALVENFDVDLLLELRGISEASNVSLEHLAVLNHYTDMRDINPNGLASCAESPDVGEDAGGCSIIFSPTKKGPILGQTWDIHSSAEPYVILMKINGALVFSATGCVGMTGINQHGVAVAINNLSSLNGGIGILWPLLIRKMLTRKSALEAQNDLMNATIGSGRHYAICDEKHFFGTEVSCKAKEVITTDFTKPYFHTNHCLNEKMAKDHFIREGSNTMWRYQHLINETSQQDLSTDEKVFLAFKDVSIPAVKNQPHKVATCGTMVMNINQRSSLACTGIASEELLKWPQTRVQT